jgi:NAD(P)-dependent dehydrogenase (short-subunit alcohol dehydrogenase family)
MTASLAGKVALVAGATRGAGRGIAVQLGAAGATVYVTGRSTRAARSEMNRPETIEETAALVDQAGGRGIAVQVDHLVPEQVSALVTRIRSEQGRLHILVNDIWGATRMEWNKTAWESSLDYGLRTLRLAVDAHAITSHFAIPLLIETPGGLVVEVTDGTAEYNETHYRVSFFYDLAKAANLRMAFALAHARSWAGPSSRSPRSPTWRGGTASRCPAASSRRSTASPISMAVSPMPGATWSRSRTPASPPTSAAIGDLTAYLL